MLQRSETKTARGSIGYADPIRASKGVALHIQMVGRGLRTVKEPVQILHVPDCESMGVVKVESQDWYYTGKLFSPPEKLSNGQVRVDRGHGLEYWNIGPRGSNHSLNDGFRDSKWRAASRWAMNQLHSFGSAANCWNEGIADAVNYLLSKVVAPVVVFMLVVFASIKVMLLVASAIAGVDL